MLPKLKVLVALIVLALPFGCAGQPAIAEDWSIDEMNRTIDQTNFMVNDNCSGTLIDTRELFILTANHCVTEQYQVIEKEEIEDGELVKKKIRRLKDGEAQQIEFKDGDPIRVVTYRVRLVAVDKDFDLALLQLKSANIGSDKAAKLGCETPRRGERIFIVGNPQGVLYSSVVPGMVSSVQRNYDTISFATPDGKKPLMQISGGVVGGNSGGAVYSAEGRLIGVPVIANDVNEMLAWAVPPRSIREFLSANKLARLYDHCKPKTDNAN
jgi:S1-C subfamily serine protease